MGKNQAYKQMQRAKASSHSSSAAPGEEDGRGGDGMVDGTFHSPEWHAARLASLQTTHTVTWEEWKAQRKEEARKQQEMEGFEEKRMREYREQLDKERANKLSRGRNHADKRDKVKKNKDKGKDKDKDKDKSKKRKSKKRKSSDSDSSNSDDSSDKKSKKKKRKSKKVKGSDGDLSSASEEEEGPVRLSSFFTGGTGDLSDSDDEKSRKSGKGDPLRDALEEAKRRAEIGAHMVAEVKKADELAGKPRSSQHFKDRR